MIRWDTNQDAIDMAEICKNCKYNEWCSSRPDTPPDCPHFNIYKNKRGLLEND